MLMSLQVDLDLSRLDVHPELMHVKQFPFLLRAVVSVIEHLPSLEVRGEEVQIFQPWCSTSLPGPLAGMGIRSTA